jgi:hypothetical protein
MAATTRHQRAAAMCERGDVSMNNGLKTVIRWLAIATLALFVVATVIGLVHLNQPPIRPQPQCPGSDHCFPILATVLSVGSSLSLVVVTLCLVMFGLAAISAGRRRGWLAVFVILAVLLVLSPTLRWLLPQDIADFVTDLVTTALAVVALLAALLSLFVVTARGANASNATGSAGNGG